MADGLAEYVRRMLQAGYTAEQVRSQLLQSGYDAGNIDAALAGAGMSGAKKTIKPLTIAIALGAVLALAVVGIILAGVLAPEPIRIELSGRATRSDAVLGETASFAAELENPSGRKATVLLSGELIEDATGDVVARSEQQLSLRDSASPLLRFDIPADARPGQYHARIVAAWDGEQRTTDAGIRLLAPEEAPEAPPEQEELLLACPAGCDDFNRCTTDVCAEGQCVHEAVAPCCGNQQCEPGESADTCREDCRPRTSERPTYELRAEAEDAAADDPALAQDLCAQIVVDAYADECFAAIAPSVGVDACDNIVDVKARDACIVEFAVADPALCSGIQGRTLRTSCYAMAQARAQAT